MAFTSNPAMSAAQLTQTTPSFTESIAQGMDREPYHKPADLQSGAGVVREVKSDGTMVEMTPAAAVITAVRLLEAASKADGDDKLAAEAKARQRD